MFKLVVKQSTAKGQDCARLSQPTLTQPNQGFSGLSMSQRALGHQAVLGTLQNQEWGAGVSIFVQKPCGFGHEFSRIPVHPRPTSASENPTIDRPGDSYEQEADRVAEQVMSLRQPNQSYQQDALSHNTASVQSSVGNNSSEGKALTPETRQFFEPRFGHSFANVRVHTDRSANEAADSLGARAYTIGEHIAFASGYQPSMREGRQLLAHELAHVVQQSRGPLYTRPRTLAASLSRVPFPKVQRKLVATGDAAGFATLANSVITVQVEVVVSPKGQVSLRSTGVQGPPTREQHELVATLQRVIGDSKTTSIEFIRGATSTDPAHRSVLIGAYSTSQIDLDDIAALGFGLGGTTIGTALAHEIIEQYRKQVHGEAFPVAHRAGERAEEAMSGATRGTHSIRQINATTIEVTVPWTYPNGRIVDVVMTVTNGNVTGVTRRVRP